MIGLAETLRSLRKARGMSQRELADRMGVHENTVLKLEQNPERALFETIEKACDALGSEGWQILRHARKSQRSVGVL